jgi:hypothetical protein
MPSVTDVAVTPGALAVFAAVEAAEWAAVVAAVEDDLALLLQAETATANATPSDTADRLSTRIPP